MLSLACHVLLHILPTAVAKLGTIGLEGGAKASEVRASLPRCTRNDWSTDRASTGACVAGAPAEIPRRAAQHTVPAPTEHEHTDSRLSGRKRVVGSASSRVSPSTR